jgi:SecD/SecF fusion protein
MKFIPLLLLLILFSCANEPRERDLKNVKPGKLEFFETYSLSEILPSWNAACKWIKDHDTLALEGKVSMQEMDQRGLAALVQPNGEYMVGYVYEEDIPEVDKMLAMPEVKKNFFNDLRFLWSYGVEQEKNGRKMVALYATKIPREKKAKIDGRHIVNAERGFNTQSNVPVITITMTQDGAHDWEIMTRNNIGRAIAITLDDHVLSCPIVNNTISGGSTEISGNFTAAQAEELANRIYAGRK